MATSKSDTPELGFWEKVDLPFAQLSIFASVLYAAITGVFRGKDSPKKYSHHIMTAAVRKAITRLTDRQNQYMATPDRESYTTFMQNKGLQPEIVSLPHGAEGYWLGNKDAKNVLIYYHGGGFVLPAIAAHFEFHTSLIQELNANGHEIAVFFLRYTLTPHGKYPTQLRQTVEALRYIVTETNRSPSNVVVGGDSAGGNLAMATLLHLSHPHPAIDPLQLSAPLAGVFGFAPWINFSADWPSMSTNAYKDLITPDSLVRWASAYLDGKKSDAWSEPDKAPAEWWKNPKTERILILVGGDEILLSPIEAFAQKIKSVFPNTTYIVGNDESHDAPFYTDAAAPLKTQTARDLRQWLAARL